MLINCPHYNFTYSNRGHSFENALIDGLSLLADGKKEILVGGVDEANTTVHRIVSQMGWTQKTQTRPESSEKPVLGEGATFFLMANENNGKAIAKLEGVETFRNPEDQKAINDKIGSFLKEHETGTEEIAALITGHNGDETDKIYDDDGIDSFFAGTPVVKFKHLSGEYFTASAFAFNLASNMLNKQEFYSLTTDVNKEKSQINKVLIYNHFNNANHTLALLSRC